MRKREEGTAKCHQVRCTSRRKMTFGRYMGLLPNYSCYEIAYMNFSFLSLTIFRERKSVISSWSSNHLALSNVFSPDRDKKESSIAYTMKEKLDSFFPRHISRNLHHLKKNHNSKRVIIERVLTDDISTRVLSLIRLSGLVEKDLIHPEDVREIERREWNIERFFKGIWEEVDSDYTEFSSVSEPDNSSQKQDEQLPCNTCIYRYLQRIEDGLGKRKKIGERKVSPPSPTSIDKWVEEVKEKLSETIVRNLLWRKKINYRSLSFSFFPEEFFQTGLYEFGFVDSPRLDDGERGATTTTIENDDDCSCSEKINPHHPSSGFAEDSKSTLR